MEINKKIHDIQVKLKESSIDGWLLFDFRRSNDLAHSVLEIPSHVFFTRRFFYWIPSEGSPCKLVHKVEASNLDHLPGEKHLYLSWNDLESALALILKGSQKIIMEYSPKCAVPYLSKVDAGTLELVKEFVPIVESSGNILQTYTSVWDDEKRNLHFEAAEVVDLAVARAWDWIKSSLEKGETIFEYDVQRYLLKIFSENDCVNDGDPIVAVNGNAADPHYIPSKEKSSQIKEGDFILIDLWCKKNHPRATYADIARVAKAAHKASEEEQKVFQIVKEARDAAVNLVKNRFASKEKLFGWEVDQVCRDVISKAGYENEFIHRTGHNIDTNDHGDGAHMDNLESKEMREVLPGTCFSIEPGIYLPGKFGVRLEINVVISLDGIVEVTGGIQEDILCLFSNTESEAIPK